MINKMIEQNKTNNKGRKLEAIVIVVESTKEEKNNNKIKNKKIKYKSIK